MDIYETLNWLYDDRSITYSGMKMPKKELTPPQRLKLLTEKQKSLAVMVEIIKLRLAIQNVKATDEQIFDEAEKSFIKTGQLMTAKKRSKSS